MTERFTVWTWFEDGSYEPDGPPVEIEAAVKRAHGISESVGAKLGVVKEIRIVDGGDETVFEWIKGKGVTFPPRPEGV